MIVVELQAAIDAAGTIQTFYLSTDGYTTTPSDTPANMFFDPRLKDPASIGISAFGDGRTGGATKLESGEIVIENVDGDLDGWLNYSFDGRPVVIRVGNAGDAYPSSFKTILSGTAESLDAGWSKLVVVLKDKQWYLDRPLLTTTYLGNNSLPNGLEGVSDIIGKVKPRVYGKVFNITPVLVNTSKLTYQVSDGIINDISAVYDRGLSLTKGTNHATSTLLQASTVTGGTYETCFAEGYFRLGSTPAGEVTADVLQGSSAANRTAAQILNSVALSAGLSAGEISSSDVTALDTATSAVLGVYVNDESTSQSVMDSIAQSVSAWFGFDSLGVLRMGRLLTPTTSEVLALDQYDIEENIERRAAKDTGIPAYRVTVDHTKMFTVQTSDFAGAVSIPTRAIISQEYRTSKAEDLSILTQWKSSEPLQFTTLLTSSTDADTEAARLLAIYKVKRDVFDVPLNLKLFTEGNAGNQLKILDVVKMTLNRFGMNSGRYFRLIGYRIELKTETCILTLWG